MLLFCDFDNWSQSWFRQLELIINAICLKEYERNLLTVVHNPILIIALSCELLTKIAKYSKLISIECQTTKHRFISLVLQLIDHQRSLEVLKALLTEVDYKNRSALQIIMHEDLPQMVNHSKVRTILDEMWNGKETFKCNGKIQDFSLIYSRWKDPINPSIFSSLNDRTNFKFWDVIQGSMKKPKITEEYYWVQYFSRHRSINYLFLKEFLLSCGMVSIFQLISYTYLNSFKKVNIEIDGMTIQSNYEDNDVALIRHTQVLIDQYKMWTQWGLFMCFCIFLHLFQKMTFNFLSGRSIPIDMWSKIDLLTAFGNSLCLSITSRITTQDILDKLSKQKLDFYVCAVVTITWFRFFSYFLIFKKISKLLITLFTMLQNTLSFMFLLSCYLIIAATIFTMRFSKVDEEMYGTVFQSVRTLFDAMVTNYNYVNFGRFERAHSIFLMAHLIITAIFLIQYLVAVLKSIYEMMIHQGEYRFLKMKYLFYDKYQNLFSKGDKFETEVNIDIKRSQTSISYLSEICMHAPPMNMLGVVLMPILFIKKWRQPLMIFLSRVYYWIENVVLLGLFICFCLVLSVPLFLKLEIAFLSKMKIQCTKTNFYPLLWLFFGFLILIFQSFKDTFSLFKILKIFVKDENKQEKSHKAQQTSQIQIGILNEVMYSTKLLLEEMEKIQNPKMSLMRKNQVISNKKKQSNAAIREQLDFLKELVLNPKQDTHSLTLDKEQVIAGWLMYRQNSLSKSRQKQTLNRAQTQLQKNLTIREHIRQKTNISLNSYRKQNSNRSKIGQALLQKVLRHTNTNQSSNSSNRDRRRSSQISKFIREFQSQKRRKNHFQLPDRMKRTSTNLNFSFREPAQKASIQSQEAQLYTLSSVDLQMIELVDNFLSRFIFVSKQQGHNQVNLKLILKALPEYLTLDNFFKVKMINFVNLQMGLVSFQNQKMDELFNYYDSRNMARVQNIKHYADESQNLSQHIQVSSIKIKNKLVKLFQIETQLRHQEALRRKEIKKKMQSQQQQLRVQRTQHKSKSSNLSDLFPVAEESEFEIKNQDVLIPPSPSRMITMRNNYNQFDQVPQVDFGTAQGQIEEIPPEEEMMSSEMFSDDDSQMSDQSFSSFSDIIKEEDESQSVSDPETDMKRSPLKK